MSDHHLESLDVFRGATIAAMILVNNPGDWNTVFSPLLHSAWNGCSVADVIFPFFVFIMGCAMPFAFARRDARSAGQPRISVRVIRRAITLIALGVVLNLVAVVPDVAAVRLPGVLQRLGLAYGRSRTDRPLQRSQDDKASSRSALVFGHWALLTLVPFGGHAPEAVTRGHNLAGLH